MKKLLFIWLAFSSIYGCVESEPLVEVETYDRVERTFNAPYVEVKVTSTTDSIEILDIIVNRGNCSNVDSSKSLGWGEKLPRKLSFGQSVNMHFAAPCSAKQVDVITNLGDWIWEY